MKVLWISAAIFSDVEEKQSGVWQKALALKLSANTDIQLYNIAYQNKSKDIIQNDFSNIKQWGIPRVGKNRNGYPPEKVVLFFKNIVKEINPDIVHIWGSENAFKLLPLDNDSPGIKVISMQGVLGSIAEVLLSGLTFRELISTIGIRELIKRENLFSLQRSFFYDASVEEKMIKKCSHIITQSEWTESQIKPINRDAHYYRIHRVLRTSFIEAKKWTEFDHKTTIIYSAAVGYTLKGLHVLIKALSIVKSVYPDVELRLAGSVGRKDFIGDGYIRLIHRMINKFGLQRNIIWLGAISASEIVRNLQEATVFVNPSYVESYSLVVAEAMSVGTPSVISNAGAMPELAENNKEALFFSPGDYRQCAHKIIRLLSDPDYAKELSVKAQMRATYRNSIIDTATEQIKIYQKIRQVEETKKGDQI